MRKICTPNKSKLLLAHPFLTDSNFSRSVILITEHNQQGTTGFILNKSLNVKVHNAIEDFPDFEGELFLGGPVHLGVLHFLHRCKQIEDAFEVMEGLFWGGNFESLKSLIAAKEIAPADIRFFIGYSGWSSGQLKSELAQNSWIVTTSTIEDVFDKKKNLWKNILKEMGGKYSMLAHAPQNPDLN